jgi:hypothetical protein
MTHSTHTLSAPLEQATDGLLLADGTLWSHACTVGRYNKGEEFKLDRPAIENFVRVFTTGYPNKVPVDYEHASTSNDPEVRKLRAQGEIPKAGEVKELVGVFSAADFTGELLATAQRLSAKVGRPLDDPQNLGLWMRWKPTPKALEKIQAGEFSELSITFDDDYPDKKDGKGQGPTILAVALTMMPFLDEMLPVAASRGGRREYDPAAGTAVTDSREEHIMSTKMLAATTALTGKPVASEEEAVVELTALQPEVVRLRSLNTELAKQLGVEPEKIVETVKALSTKVAESEKAAKEAREREIASSVESTVKAHESKLTPLSRKIFARELSRELHAGVKLDETETVKALTAMPELDITNRATGADIGSENATDDVKLDAKAKEIMASDAEVKALSASHGHSAAFSLALRKASTSLRLKAKSDV